LHIPENEMNYISSQLPNRYTKNVLKNIPWSIYSSFEQVDMSQFDLIADWYYFGILTLAETKLFKSDPKWIAKRLNIKLAEAHKAIDTLIKLDLLKLNSSGQLKPTGKHYTTSTDISNAAIRKHHLQNLDILRNSIVHDPVELRDLLTMTMTFDPAQMSVAKKMIDEFQKKFTKKMEKTPKKEVYRLSIQFIPLSQETNS
jgi:uncharacterized protein (TIGR02147 family)